MDEQVKVLLVILAVVFIGLLTVHVVEAVKDIRRIDRQINGHVYVDLGLPSGLKWATCNVGADFPTKCGTCFTWGKTEPYSEDDDKQGFPLRMEVLEKEPVTARYSIVTVRFVNTSGDEDGASDSDNGDVDGNNISGDARRDAARANWGSTWRMPTWEEMGELVEKCSWQWVRMASGTVGFKVTGPNGDHIFLPGAANGDAVADDDTDNNPDGCYWTSESSNRQGLAYNLKIDKNLVSIGFGNTACAFYVRPVSE